VKKILIIAISMGLATSAVSLKGQDPSALAGYWEGGLIRGDSLQIMKAEFVAGPGSLVCRATVPDWEFSEWTIPVLREGEQILLRFLYGEGRLTYVPGLHALKGTMRNPRTGEEFAMQLNRCLKPAEKDILHRELSIPSGTATLSGTLYLPARPGPHPCWIYFHGRDEGTRFFRPLLAAETAKRGVAGFLFDRRGEGRSTGDKKAAVFRDLVEDGVNIVRFLKTQPGIDPAQIGLIGWSSGGWIIPEVAVRIGNPAFIVTFAGPAASVWEQQLQVVKARMKDSGKSFTDRDFENARKHEDLYQAFSHTGRGWEDVLKSNETANAAPWKDYVDIPSSPDNPDTDWIRRFQTDPTPSLKKIKAPFLAFYGESDWGVPDEDNVPLLEVCLTEAGNKDYRVIVLPRADHWLLIPAGPAETGGGSGFVFRRTAPGFGQILMDWILNRVKTAEK